MKKKESFLAGRRRRWGEPYTHLETKGGKAPTKKNTTKRRVLKKARRMGEGHLSKKVDTRCGEELDELEYNGKVEKVSLQQGVPCSDAHKDDRRSERRSSESHKFHRVQKGSERDPYTFSSAPRGEGIYATKVWTKVLSSRRKAHAGGKFCAACNGRGQAGWGVAQKRTLQSSALKRRRRPR